MVMEFANTQWYRYLDHGMQDLVKQAFALLVREERDAASGASDRPHDYSFVVFPMAKAYEGFLKKWLFQTGLIQERDYRSDHFRIGKSLNPSLPSKYKHDGFVYDSIVAQSSDPALADKLWRSWKQGRNLPFHFFPNHKNFLTLPEARSRIEMLAETMAEALRCQVGSIERVSVQ